MSGLCRSFQASTLARFVAFVLENQESLLVVKSHYMYIVYYI